MDRIAWIIVAIYFAFLALFTAPYTLWAIQSKKTGITAAKIAQAYADPGYWLFLFLVLLSLVVLLWIPVKTANRRPVEKAPVWVTVAFGSFFMALIAYTLMLALFEVFYLNKGNDPLLYAIGGIAISTWLFWAGLFARAAKKESPDSLSKKITGWLLRGSILELLIAIPSHIYVRQKDYCSAGFFTFFGLTTGICVMLIAFGPGVYFLYRARIRQKRGGNG